MKTFNQLVQYDRLYRGTGEETAVQITKIEENPHTGGRIFYIWVNDTFLNVSREDHFEVPHAFLDDITYRRSNYGIYYSCREAALRLKIQCLQGNINGIQAVINEKRVEIAKIQREIDGYANLLNSITPQR